MCQRPESFSRLCRAGGCIRIFGESRRIRVDKGLQSCFYQNSVKFLSSNEKVPKLKQVWKKSQVGVDQRHKTTRVAGGAQQKKLTSVHLENSLDLAWHRGGGNTKEA